MRLAGSVKMPCFHCLADTILGIHKQVVCAFLEKEPQAAVKSTADMIALIARALGL